MRNLLSPLLAALSGNERARTGTLMVAGSSSVSLAQLLRFKILAVVLGLSGVGLVAQVYAVQSLVIALAPAFSGVALMTVLSERRAKDSEVGLARAAARSFALVVTTVGIGLLALPVLAMQDVASTPELGAAMLAGLIGIPFGALAAVEVIALQERGGFARLAAATTSAASLSLILIWALAWRFGIVGAAVGLSAGWLLTWCALLAVSREKGARLFTIDAPTWGRLWQIGSTALLATVVAAIGTSGLRFLALSLAGADAAGVIHALLLVSLQLIGLMAAAIGTYSSRRIIEFVARRELDLVRDETEAVLKAGMLSFGIIVLALAAVAGPAVSLVFSDEFVVVARILPIQLVGDLLRAQQLLTAIYLLPMGHRRISLLTEGIAAFVLLAGSAVLYGTFGVLAFPLSYVIAAGCSATITVWHSSNHLRVSPRKSLVSLGIASMGLVGAVFTPMAPLFAAIALVVPALPRARALVYDFSSRIRE